MRILGFRASTKHFRYCVLDLAGAELVWINHVDEHKWEVPKSADTKPQILGEVFSEANRLLKKYMPDRVVLKSSETMKGSPSTIRVSVEAVIILAAQENHIPAYERKYRDIKTNSDLVEAFVLNHVAKTSRYWDSEIADALAVALRELGK